MAQEWYYAKDGTKHGPITSQQLKELAASGELRPTDLVWAEGQDEWKPAQSINGLCSTAPVPPPVKAAKPVGEKPVRSGAPQVGIVQQLSAKFNGLDAQKKLLVSIIGGTSLLMFLCCGSCGLLGMIGNLLDPNPQSSTTDSEEHENGSQAVTSQSNQVASSDSATSLNDKVTLDEETALQLLDRPESFKGRTITCKVFYDGAGLRRGDRLFQMPVLIFAKGGNVTVQLDIPNDIDLPSIQPGQNLVVTWLCNNGSIEFGNEVLDVRRP